MPDTRKTLPDTLSNLLSLPRERLGPQNPPGVSPVIQASCTHPWDGGISGGRPRVRLAPHAPPGQPRPPPPRGKAKGAPRPPALLAPKPLPVKKVTRGWGSGDSSRKPPAAPGDTEGRQPAGWQLLARARRARRHGLPAAPAARPRLQGDFRALQRLRPHGDPPRTPSGGGR